MFLILYFQKFLLRGLRIFKKLKLVLMNIKMFFVPEVKK